MKNKRLQELAGITEALNDPVANYESNKQRVLTTLAKLTKLISSKKTPTSYELKKAADGMRDVQGSLNYMSRSVDDWMNAQ